MRPRGIGLAIVAVAIAGAAPAHRDVEVTWVRAEHYAGKASHPARFYPGHLVDGATRTATCFARRPDAPLMPSVAFGLRGAGRITALRIANGDQRTPGDAKAHGRVEKLMVQDGSTTQWVTLANTTKPQVVTLHPAVGLGGKVRLSVESAFGKPRLTCLSEVTFLEGGHPVHAVPLGYRRWRSALEGPWAAGPKWAPDRFLTLDADGRYRFTYTPPGHPDQTVHLTGRWVRRGHTLRFEHRGTWWALHFRLRAHVRVTRPTIMPDSPAAADPNVPREMPVPARGVDLTGGKHLPPHLAGRYRSNWT